MTDSQPSEVVRRRRRPAVSCTNCRKRKIRCNRELPCNHCIRARSDAACVYDVHPPLVTRAYPAVDPRASYPTPRAADGVVPGSRKSMASPHSLSSAGQSSTTLASGVRADGDDLSSTQDVRSLQRKIRELQAQLAKRTRPPTPEPLGAPDMEEQTTRIGGTIYYNLDAGGGHVRVVIRSIGHKRRLFGQGHWMILGPWIRDLLDLIEGHVVNDTSPAFVGLQRCKHWARVIKERRTPSWPCPPTRDMPARDVADALVEAYLGTFETLYRVLHVPSFRRDYEAFWTSDPAADRRGPAADMAFVVQLKLVMAIGAATLEDGYPMRTTAIRWVYEAHTWVSNPIFKARVRPDLVGIQNHILLLVARELTGVDDDSVWVAAGALLREGMYIGLHRDPSRLPRHTRLAAEMRRRLWSTILEVSLQMSLNSGSPPHVTLDDFDAAPPGNYDDEQLLVLDDDGDNDGGAVQPHPDSEGTDTSASRALRKTFPQRLAVARLLNDTAAAPSSYEDTLRLDADLRRAHRALAATLATCCPPDAFAPRAADYILRHHLACLHAPYLGLASRHAAYAYSRKVAVDASLRIWAILRPSGPASGSDPLVRLAIAAAGFFRTIAFQAAFAAALEVKIQLLEDVGLGPAVPRPDLLAVVEDARRFTLRALEAGRTNMKGHLLLSMLAAHIDGIRRGLERDELFELIGRTAVEVEERVLPILQRVAAECEGETPVAEEPQPEMSVDYMGDWVLFGEACGTAFPMGDWGDGVLADALDY